MKSEINPFEVYKGKVRRLVSLPQNKKVYVNLLSVYDMLLCEKMAQILALKLINEGFEKSQATTVAENACLSLMCLTNNDSLPLFENTKDLMDSLTAEDMLCVVKEYSSLRRDYLGFDLLDEIKLEQVKKN